MQIIGRMEQQAIDRLWQIKSGLPLLLLMEAAAAAVSRICCQLLDAAPLPAGPILILAGKGQNGGDALACARLLRAAGRTVICREVFPGQDLPPEAATNRQAALALDFDLGLPSNADFDKLTGNSLIVDGIFGTGFQASRQLPPAVCDISRQIAAARARGARVVAIDLPTGLDADSGAVAPDTIQADYTVTFVRPKIGICAAPGRFLAGRIFIETIGVPDRWVDEAISLVAQENSRPLYRQIETADITACRPARPADSHKGLFGKVLLLGGAPGMPGAIVLAAEAAARSGAGLLTLGVPAAIAPLVLAARPECLLTQLPEPVPAGSPDDAAAQLVVIEKTEALISQLISGRPAVAAGPGSGRADWLIRALPLLIRGVDRLVLDADALNLIADDPDHFFPLLRERVSGTGLAPAILTPHPGEFRRLAPDLSLQDRQEAAFQLAGRTGCLIVLKGASTVIASPQGPILINPTGHDGLARGGSGDVLCGLIAGLLAQGLAPAQAAMAGVYLHGAAADLAADGLSRRTMLPRDVIAGLGGAFRQAGWE